MTAAAAGPEVVAIGETMASLRAEGPLRLGGQLHLSVAGAESTVAVGVARLGRRAAWVGVVGDDELGALILRSLRAEAVDLGAVRVDPGAPTGLMLVEPRLGDVTRVTYRRSGSAGSRLATADVDNALATGPAWLHCSGITPALSDAARHAVAHAFARARAVGCGVSFAVNYRAALWSPEAATAILAPLATGADLVVAAHDELRLISPLGAYADDEKSAGALLDAGVGEVVITRGAKGATAYTPAGTVHRAAAAVTVVDTVGAGDAFVAGYLTGILDGLDAAGRLEQAVATAAFAVACRGDWEGLPTRAELGLLEVASGTTVR